MAENSKNFTKTWKQTEFFSINDESNPVYSFIKNSAIVSIHLYKFDNDPKKHLLLIGLDNYDTYNTDLLKIMIINQKIEDVALINFKSKAKILGAYDMNLDGLIDIVYYDSKDNLYILLNDDPYYLNVFVSSVKSVTVRNTPRIFVLDADNDKFPDIVTADVNNNNFGVLFNHGEEYWSKVRKFFQKNNYEDIDFKQESWNFIMLLNNYEEKLNTKGDIIDYTVFQTKSKKRLNFEIFAIFDNDLFWFVEKDLNIPANVNWGNHKMEQNYMYSMTTNNIVVDQQRDGTGLNYDFILEIDINGDEYPEFILYSIKQNSLYWIKKYVPYITGFGWDPNFWIYMIIYIYIVSSVVGMYEFYRLKKLNDQIAEEKLLKEREREMGTPSVNIFQTFDREN